MTFSPLPGKYVSVQLGKTEELILDILRQEEMYGLEIVERSNGALRRATIYNHLSKMEERGLVYGEREEPQLVDFGRSKVEMPARRRYRATQKGWETFLSRHDFLPKARIV